MVRGLAEAARALDNDLARTLAIRGGTFLLRELVHEDRAMRVWSAAAGNGRAPGYLDDQAAAHKTLLDAVRLIRSEG